MSAEICTGPTDSDSSSADQLQAFESPSVGRMRLAFFAIFFCGLLVYTNSFHVPFILDDVDAIPENPSIRQLRPISRVLSPPGEGQAVQRRPVVNLSLAVNYATGGLRVEGYHVFNLAVHILAGLVLFGVIRRTLLCGRLRERFGRDSWALALICSLIWLVHPLQTEAVTYIIQRTELLAGLFYLLSLYCVIRGSGTTGPALWYTAAIISCLLGMGSKEIVVSAPLVIFVYDRVFLSRSIKEVLRRRWFLYAGLCATWVLIPILLPHGHEGTSLFGRGGASPAYALTQFESVATYLRLCFWPAGQIFDYGYFEPSVFWRVVPYAIFVIMLLLGTAVALWYRPGVGFLGLWFFCILAPSSSVVPLMGQATAEKRMYLPLAAVVVGVVLYGCVIGKRLLGGLASSDEGEAGARKVFGYVVGAILVVVLGVVAFVRNQDYRTAVSIWEDTVHKRPGSRRAYHERGLAYTKLGEYERAIRDFDQAIKMDSKYAKAYNNRGVTYLRQRKYRQAILDLDEAIELNPKDAKACNNRGLAHGHRGDHYKAIASYTKAIELNKNYISAYNNRGAEYLDRRIYGKAILDFDWAIKLNPRHAKAYNNRGLAYAGKGDYDQAIRDFGEAIKWNPGFAQAYKNRASAYRSKGEYKLAQRDMERAAGLNPRYGR